MVLKTTLKGSVAQTRLTKIRGRVAGTLAPSVRIVISAQSTFISKASFETYIDPTWEQS